MTRTRQRRQLAAVFLLLLLPPGAAPRAGAAEGPSLTYEERGQTLPLPVEKAEIEVRLLGDVAETTLTLRFRNPTARMLEGEFVMPLPEGATVSSYALEVNGALREAVSVEKEQARNAYESIKRQMVDPGLVEREADNVYRTRVFPIPANGTKELRIGYVETLRGGEGTLAYRLPIAFDLPVGDFTCTVRREGAGALAFKAPVGLEFKETEGRWEAAARAQAVAGTLEVAWMKPPGVEVFADADARVADGYALAFGAFPEDLPPVKRPPLKRIKLVWDASDSARTMEREKVFALLDAWFREVGTAVIQLELARNTSEEAGDFPLKDGEWKELRARLADVFYDGATDFSRLAPLAAGDEITVLVTDGVALRPEAYPTPGRHALFVVNASPQPFAPLWTKRVAPGGGAVLETGEKERADALLRLGTLPRLVSVRPATGEGAAESTADGWRDCGFSVSFPLVRQNQAEVRIILSNGKDERTLHAPIRLLERGDIPRRLWAQRRLARMEEAPVPDVGVITDFARQQGLVSSRTSLIVLEKLDDYVRYRIPPPEAEMKREYEARARIVTEDAGDRARMWREKLAWYDRGFPWVEVMLLNQFERAAIWKKAVEKTFTPEERDEPSYRRAALLCREGVVLIGRKDALRTAAEKEAWIEDLARFAETLSEVAPEAANPGAKVTVAVGGLVREPRKVTVKNEPLTLREAVERAGGPLSYDSYAKVTLYRQGRRTTYNLLSKAYTPQLLRSGDMIVVEYTDPYGAGYGNGADPFGGVPQDATDVRDLPAVVEEEGEETGRGARASREKDPFALRESAGGATPGLPDAPHPGLHDATPFDAPAFAAALEKGADPAALYAESKGGQPRAPAFHVEAARLLFAGGHDVLAERVLSNLVEYRPSDNARRALVFWKSDFGLGAKALPERPSEAGLPEMIDAQRVLVRAGEVGKALELIGCKLLPDSEIDADTYALARTEENALRGGVPNPQAPAPLLNRNLEADVRIVFASDYAGSSFRIIEPLGAELGTFPGTGTRSECGGQVFFAPGHVEYMMRRGLPGKYRVRCSGPRGRVATVQVGLFRNWGRANQEARWVTKLVGGEEVEFGEVEVSFETDGE